MTGHYLSPGGGGGGKNWGGGGGGGGERIGVADQLIFRRTKGGISRD